MPTIKIRLKLDPVQNTQRNTHSFTLYDVDNPGSPVIMAKVTETVATPEEVADSISGYHYALTPKNGYPVPRHLNVAALAPAARLLAKAKGYRPYPEDHPGNEYAQLIVADHVDFTFEV